MSIEVGEKVKGKVTGITNFGAFVDLGDHKTGLVHISEISDNYVKDIHDVLSVGDEVTVKVLTMKDGKIGLSIRKAEDNPKPVHAHNDHGSNHSERANRTGEHASHGHTSSSNNGPTKSYNRRPSSGSNQFGGGKKSGGGSDFDSLLTGFLKESEDRLTSLKRNTEGKRGGRGGRRS
ncbi:MAG: S1 domain-containing RNA-binding protein [Lactobacillus sp.]|jgi:S1 RNA binding domain protein|nr:S1 domain-containing RNA-binding protein [Lactobacillus sp.]